MKKLIALVVMFLAVSCANAADIQWHGYNSNLAKLVKSTNLPVLIFVMSDTCHWCQQMSATTLKDQRVVSMFNNHFYPVILHANRNVEAFNQLGLQGVPTILILNNDGKVRKMIAGYKDVDQLMSQLIDVTGEP